MTQARQPDFERYLTALHCEEPDRVPLGDWGVSQLLKDQFIGKQGSSFQDQIEFSRIAGFDFVAAKSGIFDLFGTPQGIGARKDETRNIDGNVVTRYWANEHAGVITNWAQFEKFPWPSVDDFDLSPLEGL